MIVKSYGPFYNVGGNPRVPIGDVWIHFYKRKPSEKTKHKPKKEKKQ